MAIKLTADEAWTVYCALDDALAARRRGLFSKHSYKLTDDEHKKLGPTVSLMRTWVGQVHECWTYNLKRQQISIANL
jgi:hypothetical protein